WAIFGPYPNFAWTPDSAAVAIWAQGKLWRKSLPDGEPVRLTADDSHDEYQPSFSPDGGTLLYTTWSDAGLGAIHALDLASGQRRTLTTEKGFYYGPRFSPDGALVVWSKQGGGGLTGSLHVGQQGIYAMPAAGGAARRIADEGSDPQFSADGSRVFFLTGGGLKKKLMSVGLHGERPREVFDLKYVDAIALSPDGRWVAFTELFNAYVAPLPATGGAIELNKDTKALPVTRISQDVGSYLHWAADSSALHWMVGERYFSRRLKDVFSFLPGAPSKLPEPATLSGIDVGLSLPVYAPADTVAFTNARIITLRDAERQEEVIERGTVLVEGERIAA
ncbi:MAG: amidohydrolase, partial [Gammaproteobacteria bacterium HGW-Gammaproteobacteria-7]